MFDWLLDILQETGATLRLPVSFVVIEFIGTFAFAISGVRLSSAKQFDIFGAWIVGMATAIGGGTLDGQQQLLHLLRPGRGVGDGIWQVSHPAGQYLVPV